MKILYVSQYFPPEMGAPAARAAELSRHWVAAGHEVTVLTGFPNHPTGAIPQEYRRRFRHLVCRENLNGVNILRTWLLSFPNRKAHERMLNYSSFCLSAAATGMFVSTPEVVLASSPQLLVGLSGWWLARCKRARFVFEVRDLWPESLAAVGMSDKDSWLNRFLARIAGFLYRKADHIVVVTAAFKEHLIEHWCTPAEKISVVENGVETELFSPQPSSQTLRQELNLEGRLVVSYIGTLGMAQGLETLIEAAVRMQQMAPRVLFLVVGEGAEKERLISLSRSRGLSNLRFIGQQPREKIAGYICASDACLVLLKRTDLFKTVIPTKMLEFMSCARPVVVAVEGAAQRLIEEAHAGICIQPENPTDLAQAVLFLAENPALRETLGRNGRRYIVQQLSRQKTAATYLNVLEDLLRPGARFSAAA